MEGREVFILAWDGVVEGFTLSKLWHIIFRPLDQELVGSRIPCGQDKEP